MGLDLLETVTKISEFKFDEIGEFDILVGELTRDLFIIGGIDSGRLGIIFRLSHRIL